MASGSDIKKLDTSALEAVEFGEDGLSDGDSWRESDSEGDDSGSNAGGSSGSEESEEGCSEAPPILSPQVQRRTTRFSRGRGHDAPSTSSTHQRTSTISVQEIVGHSRTRIIFLVQRGRRSETS